MARTAETAAREAQEFALGAHSLGGKVLQGLINIMTAASPGKTRVYLPAMASDPDSGTTMGFLPVFLFVDKAETIRHILAPSVTYNRYFGVNSTMRYYWYPRPRAQFFTIGSYAEETNQRFTLRYEDPAFHFDRLYFKFDYSFWRDGSYRFFGFGPSSDLGRQSNYTLKDHSIELKTGVNFLERCRLTFGQRWRSAKIVDGPITSLPRISDFFPLPPGTNRRLKTFAQRLSLSYDSRDLPQAPVEGYFADVFGESAGHAGGQVDYRRYGLEARGFHPLRANQFVTGWRFLYEGETGGESVPFYERSLLGGKDSLRGFGVGRFIDNYKTAFSLEERIRLYTLKAFNVNIEFELTPYYETGAVFHERDSFRFTGLHDVVGVGFRSVVRPNVVGLIDLAYGEDGSALYVGIDYPF